MNQLNPPLKGMSLRLWVASRKPLGGFNIIQCNGKSAAWNQAVKDVRRHIRANHCANPKGKGNRARRRAMEMETRWRAGGGFYLDDLVFGRILPPKKVKTFS